MFLKTFISLKTLFCYMDELDKLRKELKDEIEDSVDVDEDSDLPITEKKTKQKKFLK